MVHKGCSRPKVLRFDSLVDGQSVFGDGIYTGNIAQGDITLQPQDYLLNGITPLHNCIVVTANASVSVDPLSLTAFAKGQNLVLFGPLASLSASSYCRGLVLAFRSGTWLVGGATISMTGLGYPGEVTDNPKFSDLIPARYRGKFKADTLDALVKLIPIGADGGVTTPGGYVGHTGSSEDWRTGGGGSGGTDGYGGPSGGAGSFGTCFCGGSGGGGGPNYGSGYLGGDAEPFGRQGGNGGIGNLGGSAGAGGGSGRPPGTATTNPGGLGAGGFLALITPYLYGEPGCSIQSMGVKGGAATAYTGPGAGSGGGIVAALMTIDAFKGTITCAGGISGDLNTRSTSAGAGGVGYISRQSGVSDQ